MGQKFTDSLSQDGLNVGLRYEEGGGGGEKSEIRNQKSNFIEIRNPISPISPVSSVPESPRSVHGSEQDKQGGYMIHNQ